MIFFVEFLWLSCDMSDIMNRKGQEFVGLIVPLGSTHALGKVERLLSCTNEI